MTRFGGSRFLIPDPPDALLFDALSRCSDEIFSLGSRPDPVVLLGPLGALPPLPSARCQNPIATVFALASEAEAFDSLASLFSSIPLAFGLGLDGRGAG